MNKVLFILALCLIILYSCREDTIVLSRIPYQPVAYDLKVPESFPQLDLPADNPLTVQGVALGKKLFFDPILSADSTMSCASCHFAALSFTDGKKVSKGIDQIAGRRSAMSLQNLGFNNNGFFWDGRAASLEAQALIPVEDSIELHNNWEALTVKIQTHEAYPSMFRKAFGVEHIQEITKELTVKAIAQFERTLVSSGNAKYDRVMRGEAEFTEDERMGYDLFFDDSPEIKDAECAHCHNAPLFTTNEYLNNGITGAKDLNEFPDKGLGAITGNIYDNGKFRAPTLRNIALTAPYMHDGRFETLEEVIEHYNSGGKASYNVSPLIRPLSLNEEEKRQLLAFLNTLTDTTFVKDLRYQALN